MNADNTDSVKSDSPRIWLPGECAHETLYLVPAHELVKNEPAMRCRDCGRFIGEAEDPPETTAGNQPSVKLPSP